MKCHKFFIKAILCVLLIATYSYAQDTTLTVTNGGNVGIGTSNPDEKLQVDGRIFIKGNTVDYGIVIGNSKNNNESAHLSWQNNEGLSIHSWGRGFGDQLFISGNSNKVGIGTSSPDEKLQVDGRIFSKGNTFDDGIVIGNSKTNNESAHLSWQNNEGLSIHSWGRGFGDQLFISGNSNKVGIGTSSPARKLHIEGATGSSNGMGLFANEGDIASFYYSANEGIVFDSYRPSDQRRLAVLLQPAGGKVGIGTMSPQGSLDVNGAIYQRGAVLYADYVFQPDYQLESIEEHSAFMWKHKHLESIPEANVDENGQEIVEVGSYRKGIVEELEKAHIYIEQLHERIKKLEEALEKLEIQLD